MGKYHIVRIITRLIIGGPTIHTVLLTKYFNDNTQTSSLLICGQKSSSEKEMDYFAYEHGVEPYFISELGREISLFNDIKCFWKVFTILKKVKPKIVHTHTAKAGLIGRLAARLAGVPVVIHTYHGHIFNHYFSPLKTRFFIILERFLAVISDAVIAISPSQAVELSEMNIGSRKISVIPLGFDFSRVTGGDKGALKERLGLPEDLRLVGIVGRLVPVKNLTLFLETAKTIVDNYERADIKFVIVGDGELKESLQRKVVENGLTDKVLFASWQEDMAGVYKDLDVLVLTSLNEGTPVTIIEAMASGCPVVSTEVGGVADVIEHGVRGFLASSGDYSALAYYIMEMLDNKALQEKMVKNAKEHVFDTYSIERLHQDLQNLYDTLLKKKQKLEA